MKSPRFADEVPRVRTLEAVDLESVFAAVSDYYKVAPSIFAARGHGHIARAAAAWLSRRLTTVTLRGLSLPLGLTRPESVSNLTGRMEHHLSHHPKIKRDLAHIESSLARKTKNKVLYDQFQRHPHE